SNPSPAQNMGSGNTYCYNVTLNSYYTRPLSNVYVQATSISDATGVQYADQSHSGWNSSPSALGLSNFYGLWEYKSTVAGTPAGVLGASGSGANTGSMDW